MTQLDLSARIEGAPEVKAMLATLGKESPHAVRLAMNELGEAMQRAMRREIPSRFHMRGTSDGFRQAIVFSKAIPGRAGRANAVLKVGGPGFGQSRTQKLGAILARHEQADTRTESGQVFFDGKGKAMTGLGFFLPAKGLRTNTTNPPRKLYPSAIGAAMRLTPDSRLILAKGTKKGSKKKGTGTSYFATREGIFQRRHTGFGGRVQVEALWWFRKSIRTPARLRLWETAEDVFNRLSLGYLSDAIDTVIERSAM